MSFLLRHLNFLRLCLLFWQCEDAGMHSLTAGDCWLPTNLITLMFMLHFMVHSFPKSWSKTRHCLFENAAMTFVGSYKLRFGHKIVVWHHMSIINIFLLCHYVPSHIMVMMWHNLPSEVSGKLDKDGTSKTSSFCTNSL